MESNQKPSGDALAGMQKEAALRALIQRTGYQLQQENGQRRYGGPPPGWDGPHPERGSEIFVGKLPRDLFEDELVPLCEKFGKIYEVRMMMDFNGNNRGYAFVTFSNKQEAKTAMKQLNNYEISPLCYSSDRQLSLDLVNVGRQRLDFLPTLQHSGAHQESSVRMSAFAQEIITLVHLVKEQYFSGDGLTLSERFSAPQSAELSEDAEELTLNQRFSSNRGFSMNLDSVLDDEEPTQGLSKPPLRGPGDLRHDLERRRQEKLEGVKVTILGNSISQHAMGADSELNDAAQSEWAGQQRRRLEGSMGPRRGAPNRLNAGPPRRNFRIPYQRHGGPAGPNW